MNPIDSAFRILTLGKTPEGADGEIINLKEIKKRGYKIFADIGCGTSQHIFELANKDTYIVLVDEPVNANILSMHLDYAKKENIPNICTTAPFSSGLPFSNGLFDRVEAHYLLTTYYGLRNTTELITELLRILDAKGLLVISGEFLAEDSLYELPEELHRSLSTIINELKGYHVKFINAPLSEYGARYAEANLTLLISKKQKAIDNEMIRLERKIGAKKAKCLDIWRHFEISWDEKLDVPANAKIEIMRLLENLFGLILVSYEKALPRGQFGGQLYGVSADYAIFVRKDSHGDVIVEVSKKGGSTLCTLRKKNVR